MPSTRDLRRRIKSIRNTSQITKAMQMVAAAKMRKAQQAAVAGRPYASLMNEVLAEVTANAGDFSHPLTEVREIRKRAAQTFVGADDDDGAKKGIAVHRPHEAAIGSG